MPVIDLHASVAIPEGARVALKSEFGRAIEAIPGKSEGWLMCLFEEGVPIYLGGDDSAPSAFLDVSSYAREEVPAGAWERLTALLTDAVVRELGVPAERVYIRYATTRHFGWNGSNL